MRDRSRRSGRRLVASANVARDEAPCRGRGRGRRRATSYSRALSRSTARPRLRDRPFRPDDATAPQDAYGAQQAARPKARSLGVAGHTAMRIFILRLPLVYGPGARAQFPPRWSTRCAAAMAAARRDRQPALACIGTRQPVSMHSCAAIDAADRSRVRTHFLADATACRRQISCARSRRRSASRRASSPVPLLLLRAGRARDGPRARRLRVSSIRSKSIRRHLRAAPDGGRAHSRSLRQRSPAAAIRKRHPAYNRRLRMISPAPIDRNSHLLSRAGGRRADELRAPAHHAPLHEARRRLGADRDGRHARAVHGERRGGRAAVPEGQGAGLAHRRVRHAAARDATRAAAARRPRASNRAARRKSSG